MSQKKLHKTLKQLNHLIRRAEALLPPAPPAENLDDAVAFRWRRGNGRRWLEPINRPQRLGLKQLLCIDTQKAELDRNTRQFLAGAPANNALLSGSRGTGKSSLIKALLTEHHGQGLRVVEVDRHDLIDLSEIIDRLQDRPEKYLLYCDDLSFEAGDPGYKALKAVLDGSLVAPPDNVLIYATSNRRHLLPEFLAENEQAHVVGTEIHHTEAVEEKISLSERFGLWLSFWPFNQEQYLSIVDHWLEQLGLPDSNRRAARAEALKWALARGSRSGRIAWQFARDYAGRIQIDA
ncbi:MAG: ATP-binding protein [Chromatiales bacterium]|nr:ATP-binding protein [Chromatiales bacterium]